VKGIRELKQSAHKLNELIETSKSGTELLPERCRGFRTYKYKQ